MSLMEMLLRPEGYLLLFALVFTEQIGLPIPAAPALMAAGALAATGHLNIIAALTVSLIAAVSADSLWYIFGLVERTAVCRFLASRPPSRFQRTAERLFSRYGDRSLLIAKFVPGLSTLAPPLSGIGGMRASRFVFLDGLGSLIWVGTFTGTGYLFSARLDQALAILAPEHGVWLWITAMVALTGIVWSKAGHARQLWPQVSPFLGRLTWRLRFDPAPWAKIEVYAIPPGKPDRADHPDVHEPAARRS